MSEEYPNEVERTYTSFWPMLIFLIAFAISSIYQLYGVLSQRSYFSSQYQAAAANLPKAQAAQSRLVGLMNDLLSTAQKDANAAQIVRQAKQAGIIRERQDAGAGTNAAPAGP